jgi:hypothetical protein
MPYELPGDINAEWISVCVPVPNDTNHRRAFLAQLAELGCYWLWDKDATKMKAADTAQVWRNIYEIVATRLNEGVECGLTGEGGVNLQHIIIEHRLTGTQDGGAISNALWGDATNWSSAPIGEEIVRDDTGQVSMYNVLQLDNLPSGEYWWFYRHYANVTSRLAMRIKPYGGDQPTGQVEFVNVKEVVLQGMFVTTETNSLGMEYKAETSVGAGWGYGATWPSWATSRCVGQLHLVRIVPADAQAGFDVRQNPADPCELQKFSGDEWVTFADTGLCEEFNTLTDVRQREGEECKLDKEIAGEWLQFADLSLCQSGAGDNFWTLMSDIWQSIWNSLWNGNPSDLHPDAPDDYFNGDNSDDRNKALCIAAWDWFSTYAAEWLNHWSFINGIPLALLILLSLFILPLGAAVGVILVATGAYLFSRIYDALQVADAFREVVCAIIDELTGQAINATNFADAGDTVLATYTPDTDQHVIATLFDDAMQEESNFRSFCYELGRVYAAILAGAELDCPCEPRWRATCDFTDSSCNFVAYSDPAVGLYNPGVGWQTSNVYSSEEGYYWTRCLRGFPTFVGESVHVTETWLTLSSLTYGEMFAGEWQTALPPRYVEPLNVAHNPAATYHHEFNRDFEDGLSMDFRTNHGWQYGGQAVCTGWIIEGTGTPPDSIIDNATTFEWL